MLLDIDFIKILQNIYHAEERYQHVIMMKKVNIINIKMQNYYISNITAVHAIVSSQGGFNAL